MRLIGTGHAGMRIETGAGSILCDPWVNPAYFASWFPFPDNSQLDWESLGQVDYLYVSHVHRDHFDGAHLRRYVSKKATVLLPEYPTGELEEELRRAGFTSFVRTTSDKPVALDGGLSIMIQALVSPTDGPVGDSSLWVEHDGVRLLNQNDARPSDLSEFARLGHVHAHLLQFSGAIWYPMVYELSQRAKTAFGKQKREMQMDRAIRYIQDLKASWVFPIAGPPCFLDEELFHYNDLGGDEGNIFPDQQVFLDRYHDLGRGNGVILLPGSVAELSAEECRVHHPVPDVREFFARKEEHLRAYQQRQRPVIEAAKASWGRPSMDVLAELKRRLEPLLAESIYMAQGVGGPVRLDLTGPDGETVESIVIDFPAGEVRRHADEKCRYRFKTRRVLVEELLASGEVDWTNELFLSCRFSAARIGKYNEFLYSFLKCLSEERLQYAEGWYDEHERAVDAEDVRLGDWYVQRRCPHLKGDLSRFGMIEGNTLTCQLHGWRFDLSTGRCLNSVGGTLRARRVSE